jgi:hypothetical protein
MRLRLYDLRVSRLPQLIGRVPADIAAIAQYANSAQRRLLMCKEAGQEGWWGTWAEMAFNTITRSTPYLTLPREVARVMALNVCRQPVALRNQFYEYLQFGNGRMPKCINGDNWGVPNVFQRNDVVTFGDFPTSACKLRVYSTSPNDAFLEARIFFQGKDSTGTVIYTTDNAAQVMGEFVTLGTPFATSLFDFSAVTGIQKDVTQGQIQIFTVDPDTGAETLLHIMEPGETVAGYRRYYFHNLPYNCNCVADLGQNIVEVRAIVKLEPIPVAVDTDYFILTNLEALIEECCAVRYSEMDDPQSKMLEKQKHIAAVQMLGAELVHYLGKDQPAVQFKPFGSAVLERLHVGMT